MVQSFLMFVLALMPIIWLIVALCGLHLQAHVASLGALAVAALEGLFIWGLAPLNVATAALEGFLMALWPITIVIIAAVFAYNITVFSGGMDVIKRMICSVSSDRRVLVLLIGWCFGGFLEGMAGFGTAVAIPASMLVALGFNPVIAILSCLLANGTPTMFGSIGIPTTTMAGITGLDPMQLALTSALQVAPFVLVTPFLMVMLVGGGRKALKGMVPTILVSAVSFVLAEIVTAAFIGAELPVIVASVCSLVATFAFSYARRNAEVPEEHAITVASTEEQAPLGVAEALRAWSPFLLIFVVLLMTSKIVPAIHVPLSSIASKVNIYAGDPNTSLTFTWINTPGVLIMLCGIVGGLIQGVSVSNMIKVLRDTLVQMSKTVVTMLGVLGCAKIMGYSGMIGSISSFFVSSLGSFYPLVSPLLGCLGTFVTGSGTSSSVLFGNVQLQAAQACNLNEYWLCSSNLLGVSAGKMLSPQTIAIGTASCGANGKEAEVLGRIFPYVIGYVVCMSLLIFVGSLLGL